MEERASIGRNEARALRRNGSRLLGALTGLLGLLAMGAGAALAGGAPNATAAHAWKVEPAPNPSDAQISVLSSVGCSSTRACTAIGSSTKSFSSPTRTLAERWNGTRWRIQSIPTPKGTSDSLYGVSCPSARACMAVGSVYHSASRRQAILTESWNGKRWRVRSAPTTKGSDSQLQDVSCVSASSCVAVGFSQKPQAIIARWNGKSWRTQAVPSAARRARLVSVSCSGARTCTAVGYQTGATSARPVAVSWNGTHWRARAVPLPQGAPAGIFDAVSCTSAKACTATGSDFTHPSGPTLAERWNGKSWQVQPTPNPANYATSVSEVELDGVSCTSATACTAIGEYSPGNAAAYFVESWNGTAWRLEPAPMPADFAHGSLLGISCRSSRCTAVGAYTGSVRVQVPLALGG